MNKCFFSLGSCLNYGILVFLITSFVLSFFHSNCPHFVVFLFHFVFFFNSFFCQFLWQQQLSRDQHLVFCCCFIPGHLGKEGWQLPAGVNMCSIVLFSGMSWSIWEFCVIYTLIYLHLGNLLYEKYIFYM